MKTDSVRNRAVLGALDEQQQNIKRSAIRQIEKGGVVAPSQWLLQLAENSHVFSQFNIHTCIPNGVNLKLFFPKDKTMLRRQKGLNEDRFTLLYISDSTTGHRKGADLLEVALERMDISVTLLVIGKGKIAVDNPKVKTISLGYVKEQTEIADYFALSNALILPSREDNLPNVMLEAFASGIPVIGFGVGGMLEHIKDGKTGVLAQDISANALNDAIVKLHNTINEYDIFHIRQYAENNFNYGNLAKEYEKIYLQLSKF